MATERAVLRLQSWAGYTEHPVEIVDETPKRYRVRHLDHAFRWRKGQVRLVPKHAIRATREPVEEVDRGD